MRLGSGPLPDRGGSGLRVTPILWRPSPNCGARRGGVLPDMIVLHYTAMANCEAAADRLCDPAFEVSAHYLIGADGAVIQMVDEALRAWHAGAGQWAGAGDVNSRSIGIELDNDGRGPFPAAQMRALHRLLPGIMRRWAIGPDGIIGHSDIAPDRKSDPGPLFDWQGLARLGLSVWPEATPAPALPVDGAVFRAALERFGYGPDLDDDLLLRAFRLRFRAGVDGPLDPVDMAMATDLGRRFVVDRAAAGA